MNTRTQQLIKRKQPPAGFFKTSANLQDATDPFKHVARYLSIQDLIHFSLTSKQFHNVAQDVLNQIKTHLTAIVNSDTTIEMKRSLLELIKLNALSDRKWSLLFNLINKTAYEQAVTKGKLAQEDYDKFKILPPDAQFMKRYRKEQPYVSIHETILANNKQLTDAFLDLLKDGVSLKNQNIKYLGFTGSKIRVFDGIKLNHVIFGSRKLEDFSITNSCLANADISNVDLNAMNFINTDFSDAAFVSVHIASTTFHGCKFTNTDFTKTFFNHYNHFELCHFQGTHFNNADLTLVKFENCTFNDVVYLDDPKQNIFITALYQRLIKEQDSEIKKSLQQLISLFYGLNPCKFSEQTLQLLAKDEEIKSNFGNLLLLFQFYATKRLPYDLLILLFGKEVLNNTLSNPTIKIELNNANGKNLNYDDLSLNNIDCNESHFINCTFKNTQMSSAIIKNCSFNHCDFTATNLNQTKFTRVDLSDISFSKANLDRIEFNECKLNNVELINQQYVDIFNCEISESAIKLNFNRDMHCNIFNSKCYAVDFSGSQFDDYALQQSSFHSCDFTNTNLFTTFRIQTHKVNFYECKLPTKHIMELGFNVRACIDDSIHFHENDKLDKSCRDIITYFCDCYYKLQTSLTNNPIKLAFALFDTFTKVNPMQRYQAEQDKNVSLFDHVLHAMMCNEGAVSVDEMLLIRKNHAPLWDMFANLHEQQLLPLALESGFTEVQSKSMQHSL